MNLSYLFGFLVGLLISLMFLLFVHRNHRLKSEYDERQNQVRGNAYKYAFYAMAIYQVLMMILGIAEIRLPLPDYFLHFLGLLIGCLPLGCYNIWKDAYWGINTNRKRYALIFLVLVALNLLPLIFAIKDGTLYQNGSFTTPILNLAVLCMLAIFLCVMLVKRLVKKEPQEDNN